MGISISKGKSDMLSYQVYEYYQMVLCKLGEFKQTIKPMLDFANQYNAVASKVLQVILGTAQLFQQNGKSNYSVDDGNLLSNFNGIMLQFKASFKPFPALSEYGRIKQDIEKYNENHQIQDKEIVIFFKKVDENFDFYQDYLQSSDDRKKAVSFGQCDIAFAASFEAIENFYSNAVKMLGNDFTESELPENKGTIDIQLLQTDFTFGQFIDNLATINEIYQEIGSVIGKSPDGVGYGQLQIVKIESGSLLAKILGDKNIIEVVCLLLHKTIELAFHKFTMEGKLLRHGELMKAIKENVEVSQKLSSLGYDLTSSKEDVEKTYALATKGLLRIAASSAHIKINDEILTVNGYGQQKYLEEARTFYLSEGSEKTDRVNSNE